jgi:hypothetical protein
VSHSGLQKITSKSLRLQKFSEKSHTPSGRYNFYSRAGSYVALPVPYANFEWQKQTSFGRTMELGARGVDASGM